MDKSNILNVKGGIKLVYFFFCLIGSMCCISTFNVGSNFMVNVGTCAIFIGTFEGYFFRKKTLTSVFVLWVGVIYFMTRLVRKMQMGIRRSSWLFQMFFSFVGFRLFTNQKMKDTIHWVQTSGNLYL